MNALNLTGIFPESGTSIEDFEGTQNISFFCELSENGNPIVTNWFQQSRQDKERGGNGAVITERNTNFVSTGRILSSGGVSLSQNTNLTILVLTEELDGTTIFCGREVAMPLADFTLRVYSKSVHVYIFS